jgi:hypothetical protein
VMVRSPPPRHAADNDLDAEPTAPTHRPTTARASRPSRPGERAWLNGKHTPRWDYTNAGRDGWWACEAVRLHRH